MWLMEQELRSSIGGRAAESAEKRAVARQQGAEAEVDQQQAMRPTPGVALDQQVLELDITMDDAVGMEVGNGADQLAEQVDRR